MPSELSYQKMLQECLRGELRIVNAGLPRSQKPLSALLQEEYPHVLCNDSSTHFFKRRELKYLESILSSDEQEALLLPILIELGENQAEVAIICQTEVEEEVISRILNMSVTAKQGRITIYKPQLALLRKMLKTTTQYLFSPRIVA
ncbi:MAG: DUF61 family protein [Dehalococcoidia bacterium]|nr:MAG: DUF61 family protein [Dehalococcoidia bacterium]